MSRWHPKRPWNGLPGLPPGVELESKAVLKRCVTARAALAELKQAADLAVTRDGAWEDWLLYMLRGVEETAAWTTGKIGAIRKLSTDTADYVRRTVPKIYSRELVDLIFEQPYCRIANVVQAQIAGRQAASRYLKALAAAGVLREQAFGKEKLFVHPKLMSLLTRDSHHIEPYRRGGR